MTVSDLFVRALQHDAGFVDFGLDLGNPDFVRYAEAYGAHGHRVERTEDLMPILDSCLAAPGVHLVEMPMDYSGNQKLLNDELVCPL